MSEVLDEVFIQLFSGGYIVSRKILMFKFYLVAFKVNIICYKLRVNEASVTLLAVVFIIFILKINNLIWLLIVR